jgi:hypothetical protein
VFLLDPLTRPAPAEESAGAGHPLPQGGEGGFRAEGEREGFPPRRDGTLSELIHSPNLLPSVAAATEGPGVRGFDEQ